MTALSFFQQIIELIGIISFAASGLIAGLRKKLDLVGVSIVAGVTAFGGGTLRDILLGTYRVLELSDNHG